MATLTTYVLVIIICTYMYYRGSTRPGRVASLFLRYVIETKARRRQAGFCDRNVGFGFTDFWHTYEELEYVHCTCQLCTTVGLKEASTVPVHCKHRVLTVSRHMRLKNCHHDWYIIYTTKEVTTAQHNICCRVNS